MDFSKQLFRASGIGHLMTEPRSKAAREAGELSETAKTHLVDIFVSERYGRNTDIHNKYVEKGLAVEEDSITLYSRVKKQFFKKNEEHLSNDYIKGTPDLFMGDDIRSASVVIDIKSSWDIYTFTRAKVSEINSGYWWQLQAYMALTGAKVAKLAYCLVNTPETLIIDEQRKLFYRMGAVTMENPDYIAACEELEKAMTFDDIPMEERVHEFSIERDDAAIDAMYSKVLKARAELAKIAETISPSPSILLSHHDRESNSIIVQKG